MDETPNVAPSNVGSGDATPAAVAVFPQDRPPQPEAESFSLEQSVAQALVSLRELHDLFETKIRFDAVKNEQIRQLSDDARAVRDGLNQRILRPLFLRLIELYDGMSKATPLAASESGDTLADTPYRMMCDARETLEDILSEFGVTRYETEGSEFTRERQRAIKTTPTTNPSLDKQVSARLRPGFTYHDPVATGAVVLRPEWVEVYTYTPKA